MTASLNRRRALSGAAAVTVGVPVLAACGSGGTDADDAAGSDAGSDAGSGSDTGGETGSGGGGQVATVADVPVGGCLVLEDQKVVLTQPTEGEIKAFSAVCTHQGCVVSSGTDGVIPCKCHGSAFSLEDGTPHALPATKPVPVYEARVVDGQIEVVLP